MTINNLHEVKSIAQSPPTKATGQKLPVSAFLGVFMVIVIYFGSQVIGSLMASAVPAIHNLPSSSAAGQFWYVLIIEALTLGMLYLFLRGRRVSFRTLGLDRPRLRYLGITLLAYVPYFVLNAVGTLGAMALFRINDDQPQQTGFETARTTTELVLTFISLVILPPLVEEIVMRGFLFGSLKNNLSVVWAALVTSLIFASAHLQFGSGAPLLWVAAIDTFTLSLVLCYLRQKTGSLWPGIGLHALKNLLAFTVLFIIPNSNLLQ